LVFIKNHFRFVSNNGTKKQVFRGAHNDFIRIWIEGNPELKIEMVNDVSARWGSTLMAGHIPVDNPANILANKLTALVSRDEPKDVFDIVYLAMNYSFNWDEIFSQSLQKALINEPDIGMRLRSFPVELLANVDWLMHDLNVKLFSEKLRQVTDDFLFAKDNSLGARKIHITEAMPVRW